MSTFECEKLTASYAAWVKKHLRIEQADGVCVIETPFLDRHSDHLQIVVERTPQGYRLTDDGHVLRDLKMSGCELDSVSRQEKLSSILGSFGVEVRDAQLVAEATTSSFPQKKHDLIQAMLAVGDLVVLARPTVEALFLEDVSRFLDAKGVRAAPRLKLAGKSGLDHNFDFIIPASSAKVQQIPERIVKAVATPNREHTVELMFAWQDVQPTRPGAKAYAFLNDQERSISPDLLTALMKYEITPVKWGERERYVPELVA